MNEKRSATIDRRKEFKPVPEERRKHVRRTSGWSSVENRWISGSEWLPVPEFDKYRFNLRGEVQSCWKGDWRPIKVPRDKNGYDFFKACGGGKRKYIRIHMLVYSYLHGVRGTLRQPICHGPVKECSYPDNLRLGTASSNKRDQHRDGTSICKLSDDDVAYIRTCDKSTYQLAKEFGVSRSAIQFARTGQSYTHVQTPPKPAKRNGCGLSEDKISLITLFTGRLGQREIANLVGCSHRVISYYQARFNLDQTPRPITIHNH